MLVSFLVCIFDVRSASQAAHFRNEYSSTSPSLPSICITTNKSYNSCAFIFKVLVWFGYTQMEAFTRLHMPLLARVISKIRGKENRTANSIQYPLETNTEAT